MIRLRQGVRPTERHLPAPAPKPRRMDLKILLINVVLALGFLLLLLLLLYFSGGEDGDLGKFGAMLLDILGA
jgi:hypothetical protein